MQNSIGGKEPFLTKGDRVYHRRFEKRGNVRSVERGLDVDRVTLLFDDGTLEANVSAKECTKLELNQHRQDVGDPVKTTEVVEKRCSNCLNQCMDMDMDPYCAAVNKPWGKVLYRGIPEECDIDERRLWQIDTRRKSQK